jgi:hypothetical protein
VLVVGAGAAITLAELALLGLGTGGGFTWLKQASVGTVASSYSLVRLAGTSSSGTVNLVQLAGILAAVALVLWVPRGRSWVGALAVGFAVIAVCAANPQPWYLLWALPLVACTIGEGGVQRAAILVLCVMTAWSAMPVGAVVWMLGLIVLAVLWLRARTEELTPGSASGMIAVGNAA